MITSQEEEANRIDKALAELETSHTTAVAKAKEDREALQKVLNDNPRVNTEPDINGEDLPEWVALEKRNKGTFRTASSLQRGRRGKQNRDTPTESQPYRPA